MKVAKDLEEEDKVDLREEQGEEEEVLLDPRALLHPQEDHLLRLMGSIKEVVLLMALTMELLALDLLVVMVEEETQEILCLRT